jgi:hypothetical protein
MVLRQMRYAPTTRIYKNGAQQSASGAVFQVVNGCAAHNSGQMLMFQGKSCSLFTSFTKAQPQFSATSSFSVRKTLTGLPYSPSPLHLADVYAILAYQVRV